MLAGFSFSILNSKFSIRRELCMSAQPVAGVAEQRLGEVLAAFLEDIDAGWAPERLAFLGLYRDRARAALLHHEAHRGREPQSSFAAPVPGSEGRRAHSGHGCPGGALRSSARHFAPRPQAGQYLA